MTIGRGWLRGCGVGSQSTSRALKEPWAPKMPSPTVAPPGRLLSSTTRASFASSQSRRATSSRTSSSAHTGTASSALRRKRMEMVINNHNCLSTLFRQRLFQMSKTSCKSLDQCSSVTTKIFFSRKCVHETQRIR